MCCYSPGKLGLVFAENEAFPASCGETGGCFVLELHGFSLVEGNAQGEVERAGACGYNRPCAHKYVGKYQSCMVQNGRLIPHASAGSVKHGDLLASINGNSLAQIGHDEASAWLRAPRPLVLDFFRPLSKDAVLAARRARAKREESVDTHLERMRADDDKLTRIRQRGWRAPRERDGEQLVRNDFSYHLHSIML